MQSPKTAVLLRLKRRDVTASMDSDRARTGIGAAISPTAAIEPSKCFFMEVGLLTSAVANAWIKERVGQIDQEVSNDEAKSDK